MYKCRSFQWYQTRYIFLKFTFLTWNFMTTSRRHFKFSDMSHSLYPSDDQDASNNILFVQV